MKNTPFKLRSGNKASYGDLQKESPVKVWPVVAKIGAWLAKGAAKAGISKAALAAGKKAIVSGATSAAASKLMSGGNKKESHIYDPTDIMNNERT